MEISPNPASDNLNLLFKNTEDKTITYSIINTIGQTIKQGELRIVGGEKSNITLDRFANGFYTLNLSSGSSAVSYKFVKQ